MLTRRTARLLTSIVGAAVAATVMVVILVMMPAPHSGEYQCDGSLGRVAVKGPWISGNGENFGAGDGADHIAACRSKARIWAGTLLLGGALGVGIVVWVMSTSTKVE